MGFGNYLFVGMRIARHKKASQVFRSKSVAESNVVLRTSVEPNTSEWPTMRTLFAVKVMEAVPMIRCYSSYTAAEADRQQDIGLQTARRGKYGFLMDGRSTFILVLLLLVRSIVV